VPANTRWPLAGSTTSAVIVVEGIAIHNGVHVAPPSSERIKRAPAVGPAGP